MSIFERLKQEGRLLRLSSKTYRNSLSKSKPRDKPKQNNTNKRKPTFLGAGAGRIFRDILSSGIVSSDEFCFNRLQTLLNGPEWGLNGPCPWDTYPVAPV